MSSQQNINDCMLDPSYFPHEVEEPVKVIETHISKIYLTGNFAYKVKKPIQFGDILDFKSLRRRQFFCEEEVFLNKRLAPTMYLGVVSLARRNVVDRLMSNKEWAVKMKQYPQDAIMENMLLNNIYPSKGKLSQIAKILFEFHQKAQLHPEAGKLKAIETKLNENFLTVGHYCEVQEDYRNIILNFISQNKLTFKDRVKQNRILDGHGDVQPRNIFILENKKPIIFDCIEFNPNLRYVDVAEEIAFLAMELDKHGLDGRSDYFIHQYLEFSKDDGIETLLSFYKSYRAYVRAKVAIFGAHQVQDITLKDTLQKEAQEYFDLAYSYFDECG